MSGVASKRSDEERLRTCYGALCAATLASSVLLMGLATFDAGASHAARPRPRATVVHAARAPLTSIAAAGDFDPRFGSPAPAAALQPLSTVDPPALHVSLSR